MTHKLPELNYTYNSLVPYIDEQTMKIHHLKHHQAYIDKLNAALEKNKELQNKSVQNLIENIHSVPRSIRVAIRNNGGGHLNHSFFWEILKKDEKPLGKILDAINKKFGSVEKFKEEFKEAAVKHFGSGWAWLAYSNGELQILTTHNQDNPVISGKIPLLCLDLWEHAYYLRYQNKRTEYVDAFFNIINWGKANENFIEAIKNPINRKCIPCELDYKPMERGRVLERIGKITGWDVIEDIKIEKEFNFDSFLNAVGFIKEVFEVAEREEHYPEIKLSSKNIVRITLSTNKVNGLSENDFILATEIDKI